MGKIKSWIRGSIIEPVVAIVILVTTIALAFSVLSRVDLAPSIKALNKAEEMISLEAYKVYTEKDYLDNEITDGAFTLEKKVGQTGSSPIINVHFEVFGADKKSLASKDIQVFDNDIISKKEHNEGGE